MPLACWYLYILAAAIEVDTSMMQTIVIASFFIDCSKVVFDC